MNNLVRFVNRTGFPCIESASVSSDGTTTTITFNNHNLIQRGFQGGFWVRFPQTIETGTDVVQFTITDVSGSTLPLNLSTGEQATTANIATTGGGVFLIFYDRVANRLQLIA